MYSNSLAPKITIPTRLTLHSKTLIENIFSNSIDKDMISGNLTNSLSDHLIQFLVYTSRLITRFQ